MSALQDRFNNLAEVKDEKPTSSASNLDDEKSSSLEEQLVNIYQELEYMNSHYPSHSPQTLTDYAKGLEKQISLLRSQGAETGGDHGIIPAKIWASIESLNQSEADSADVGIVEVDDKGLIIIYNKYEEELAGVQRNNVIGKNFFLQVAPCTNNRLFLGKFKQGVQSGTLDSEFNYTFTYKMKPTPVSIHLYRHESTGRNFVFVKKR